METLTASPRHPEPLPTVGRSSMKPVKSRVVVNQKPKGKPNASILTFFKKADDGQDELFVRPNNAQILSGPVQSPHFASLSAYGTRPESADDRYNESHGSNKKQKLDCDVQETVSKQRTKSSTVVPTSAGPFVEDLDDEDDSEEDTAVDDLLAIDHGLSAGVKPDQPLDREEPTTAPTIEEECQAQSSSEPVDVLDLAQEAIREPSPSKTIPSLPRDETSIALPADTIEIDEYEGLEDDVYEEGEEFVERLWMEEQARLEAEEQDVSADLEDGQTADSPAGLRVDQDDIVDAAATCPICATSLTLFSEQAAAVHVNDCLDGKTPIKAGVSVLQEDVKQESADASSSTSGTALPIGSTAANRFRRQPRAAKSGQANPFTLGEAPAKSGSAFSKLMSGHAEDAAWAEAAAAEHAARGKPAYQRTCPFYKILPGFNICVDAFRYGAVKGCQAYFLSHFHSDHYIGLTSTWCHGPIYCSKVTGNLVKQQLRVDPKYVVSLDWEEKVEVPGSNGVHVTMISANHCPGSSLFLYEKVIGKGNNPKIHRVLHCGDFRACRMHVEHPLLRPDVVDAISGKTRQQKLDVCYLDTTYLNPKYAFPSQENVIKACADMCVSLNKSAVDDEDGWETMKRERAGAGMVKFVRKESDVSIKQEPTDDDTKDVKPQKLRGRLLVIVGTYSIGKERICLGIARALKSKIYAPPGKQRICHALEDPEIEALLTSDPREAQVHMTPLFEIRADTLDDYLKDYREHFSRAVGFRPSGWNYRPPNSRFTESPSVQTILHSDNWKSNFAMRDLVPQRGSSSRASCFGVPYSEHSSFRELTMFCCALNIDKIIPTVNIGNAKSRERMKAWCLRWANDRQKNGLYKPKDGQW